MRENKYMWILINGKQVRVKRPPTINGIPEREWVEKNADPVWLHQNEMWDISEATELQEKVKGSEIFSK